MTSMEPRLAMFTVKVDGQPRRCTITIWTEACRIPMSDVQAEYNVDSKAFAMWSDRINRAMQLGIPAEIWLLPKKDPIQIIFDEVGRDTYMWSLNTFISTSGAYPLQRELILGSASGDIVAIVTYLQSQNAVYVSTEAEFGGEYIAVPMNLSGIGVIKTEPIPLSIITNLGDDRFVIHGRVYVSVQGAYRAALMTFPERSVMIVKADEATRAHWLHVVPDIRRSKHADC